MKDQLNKVVIEKDVMAARIAQVNVNPHNDTVAQASINPSSEDSHVKDALVNKLDIPLSNSQSSFATEQSHKYISKLVVQATEADETDNDLIGSG